MRALTALLILPIAGCDTLGTACSDHPQACVIAATCAGVALGFVAVGHTHANNDYNPILRIQPVMNGGPAK